MCFDQHPRTGMEFEEKNRFVCEMGSFVEKGFMAENIVRRIHLRFLGSGQYYWLNPEGKEGRNREICVKSLVDLS